jgi:hypothetical protein
MEGRLYIWGFLLDRFLSSYCKRILKTLQRIVIFLEYLIYKYVTRGNTTETPEIFQHDYLTWYACVTVCLVEGFRLSKCCLFAIFQNDRTHRNAFVLLIRHLSVKERVDQVKNKYFLRTEDSWWHAVSTFWWMGNLCRADTTFSLGDLEAQWNNEDLSQWSHKARSVVR